jgi:hypothetical protein
LAGLIKGLTGGSADVATQMERWRICRACTATDSSGARLFRKVDSRFVCGTPRLAELGKIIRDEAAEGCGCELMLKIGAAKASCPRGAWGEVKPGPVEKDTLCVRLDAGGIGDLCVCAYAVAGLKALRPEKRIVWAVRDHLAEWAEIFGDADEIVTHSQIGARAFEEIFLPYQSYTETEIPARGMSGFNRHELYAAKCGCRPAKPKLAIPDAAISWAAEDCDPETIILAPFASVANRTWPMHHWLQLEDLLLAQGRNLLVIDGPGDGKRSRDFKSMRYWGLPPARTAALIKRAKFLIGNDSGPAHLAGVLGTPAASKPSCPRCRLKRRSRPARWDMFEVERVPGNCVLGNKP